METPDLSSLHWWVWRQFCVTLPAMPNGDMGGYDDTVNSVVDDLEKFVAAVAKQEPRALSMLAQFIAWRLDNTPEEYPY